MRLATLILLGWVALSLLVYVTLEVMAWWYSRSARKTWGRDHSRASATAKTGSHSLPESARPQDDPSWFIADLIERTVRPK